MNIFIDAVVKATKNALGVSKAELHAPCFAGNEKHYIQDCIASTFVSSVGAYVERFEKELAIYTGARRAVAVVNGTAGLQVALQLAGVQAGDEVIVPSLTFVATANAVKYLGAVPHFVDSNELTLGLDPEALRNWLMSTAEFSIDGYRNRTTGRRIRALIPMHTFGHPCNLEALLSVAHDYRLVMVEDAAESLGSFYQGKHTGTFGKLGVLSFNGNKIITTGGGGAILTNDERLADYAKHLTTTAKQSHPWDYIHDEIGYNYRMPNLNAALGCAQLEQLPVFLAAKRKLFHRYKDAFEKVEGVEIMREPNECESNYWLQAMILSKKFAHERNDIISLTNNSGLQTRPAWQLIHRLKPYQSCPKSPLPIAESLVSRIINIPSGVNLA